MKLYYSYFPEPTLSDGSVNPSMTHLGMYLSRKFKDVFKEGVNIFDYLVPEDKIKSVYAGRFGYIEMPEEQIIALGFTTETGKAKIEKICGSYDASFLTNQEFAQDLRLWTTLEEVEPNKFLVHPAGELGGTAYPAKYIDLR